ncbi:DEAD/DEAH box helicase [Entamoeba marina]
MRYQDEIVNVVKQFQITILMGETGCGKTTMLSQILYDHSVPCNNPTIVTTNPRRIGAESVAERVSELRKTKLGELVGYRVRFDDTTTSNTKILYCTDGVLVSEISRNPNLTNYNVIIIDEAHERSLNTDFILSYTTRLSLQRKDIRIIISSATINPTKLQEYFTSLNVQSTVVSVEGRPYPVEITYGDGYPTPALNPVVNAILSIHSNKPYGDILVFLPGAEEIEKCCDLLSQKATEVAAEYDMIIIPLYAALPRLQQKRVFQQPPTNTRKIVICTNIAETSVTVPGIRYVIDQGFVKILRSSGGAEGLSLEFVSQAAAIQRSGRAGRTGEGECIRLYSKHTFETFNEEALPEIVRVNLEDILLRLRTCQDDHISMLLLYKMALLKSERWCESHGLNYQMFLSTQRVVDQIISLSLSSFPVTNNEFEPIKELTDDQLHQQHDHKNNFRRNSSRRHSKHSPTRSRSTSRRRARKHTYNNEKQQHHKNHRNFDDSHERHIKDSKQHHDQFYNEIESRQRNEELESKEILNTIDTSHIIESLYSGYWTNTAKRMQSGQYNIKNTQIICRFSILSSMTISTTIFIRWVSRIPSNTVNHYFNDMKPFNLQTLLGDELYKKYLIENKSTIPSPRTTALLDVERMEVKTATTKDISDAKRRYLERKQKKEGK